MNNFMQIKLVNVVSDKESTFLTLTINENSIEKSEFTIKVSNKSIPVLDEALNKLRNQAALVK